ncbi:MAG: histidinol-phosphate transaminase [Alphaproteobacteria bacterium]|nr:histidinol-phosphate transaminase [Alphaproteobacteria bacterium]
MTQTTPDQRIENPILLRARSHVRTMAAYSSARSLYKADEGYIFLDANECAYEPYIGSVGNNRYPAQQPAGVMRKICELYDVSSRNIVLTRGADEAIDILLRSFCEAGEDSVVICPPTFPMYAQAATIQGAQVIEVPLRESKNFTPDIAAIRAAIQNHTKIIFLCTPNNPTGGVVDIADIIELCDICAGHALVVVDETYIEYAHQKTVTGLIESYPNLVVLRTLSKAYAAAGLRAGVAIAQSDIIALMRKILAPYPIPQPVAAEIEKILTPKNMARLNELRQATLDRRERVIEELKTIEGVEEIFPSTANFILVRVRNAEEFCARCLQHKVIVRDQSHQLNLKNCVRISIGSEEDMRALFSALRGEQAVTVKGRSAHIVRKTLETAIDVRVNLDQATPIYISTGIGFYDHMLEQIAKHGGFSLVLSCEGDLQIDAHHTVEDCAIALGAALKQALGDKRGIERYGFTVPMDESLCTVSLDLSGRFYLAFDGEFPDQTVGGLPCDMVEHVFRSLAENLQANCHIAVKGKNSHHMIEACFKAFGRALRQAMKRDALTQEQSDLPSTKGLL